MQEKSKRKLFVSGRTHESAMLDLECELVCARKKIETLIERIQMGEDYRRRLERENLAVKAANVRLLGEKDTLESELLLLENEIRELRLMRGSLEALWGSRSQLPADAVSA